VDGGGVLEGWVHTEGWVCFVCLRVVCVSAGCRVEAMCDWGWVPSFALEYVELIRVVVYQSLTCFLSMADRACCW
jgi:hypothetical protein